MLNPDSGETTKTIGTKLATLADQLKKIDIKEAPATENIAAAKQTLADISDEVTTLALSANSTDE